ncbi:MAG: hypothetical protein CMJ76_13570 [Planctomycetaceae bacterium]|nr:hypothetical protein [Planctomycetaceae bacterium]
MKCPKCGAMLTALQLQDITIDKCHSCDGIWLDHGELEKLRSTGIKGVEESLEEEYGNPPAPMFSLDGYLRCPRCVDQGLRSNYVSYMQPVKMDHCIVCFGMWLDKHELDKLMDDKQQLDSVKVDKGMKAMFAGLRKRIKI